MLNNVLNTTINNFTFENRRVKVKSLMVVFKTLSYIYIPHVKAIVCVCLCVCVKSLRDDDGLEDPPAPRFCF